MHMTKHATIIGAGLAGSEAALQLAARGVPVRLYEMRPALQTPVHKTGLCAELVCSNSLKSTKPDSAAGMLKHELGVLGSFLYRCALDTAVAAGGALAVDRTRFAEAVSHLVESRDSIEIVREEAVDIEAIARESSAVIIATGPLTSDALAQSLARFTGSDYLAFYDAAAPIVLADSLDMSILFRQSRYEDAVSEDGSQKGDYLNAPFTRDEYESFIDALLDADRVVSRDFESSDLFQACQPIEEIARAGRDAPRYGPLKPVGLIDPRTGKRPWAAVQLRAEDNLCTSFNLVGFQTNLKFGEQKRVFRMIPGLQDAEFARYGIMHRNTFIDAPSLLDRNLMFRPFVSPRFECPVFAAGQLSGTEGYCEAIRSGLHAAIGVSALLGGIEPPALPAETAFGALLAHATNPETRNYQPMHVNFGIMEPLEPPVRNKGQRYAAYAERGARALEGYAADLERLGLSIEVDRRG